MTNAVEEYIEEIKAGLITRLQEYGFEVDDNIECSECIPPYLIHCAQIIPNITDEQVHKAVCKCWRDGILNYIKENKEADIGYFKIHIESLTNLETQEILLKGCVYFKSRKENN